MKKFLNTLALSLCLLFVSTWLFATDYPGGGGGAADGFTDPTAANTWTADQTYNDDINVTFGTGGDVDIDYNQSDLVINLQVAGTGGLILQESTAGGLAGDSATLNIHSTDGGATGPTLVFQSESASPADDDSAGQMAFIAEDSGGTERVVFRFDVDFSDVTSTEMDSQVRFFVMTAVNAGNAATQATLSGAGAWVDAASFSEIKQRESLTAAQVLRALRTLDVYRFRGKGRPDVVNEERHISPNADDFYNAFKAGKDPRVLTADGFPQYGIAARDVAGVALMGIQELIKENDKLKERLDVLEITVLQ